MGRRFMDKNKLGWWIFVLSLPLSQVQAQTTPQLECRQNQGEVATFIKQTPAFFHWYEQIQQDYTWLTKKLPPEQAREVEMSQCQWLNELKKLLQQANYQQLFPGQKKERCELFQKISALYEKRQQDLTNQMALLGEEIKGNSENNFTTLVGKKYYYNRVHKKIEQNLLKINNLPVTKSTVIADNFSQECGDIKVSYFTFNEDSGRAQTYNKLLNSILPSGILALKNNPLQIDALLANHFHNQEFTYYYLEDIDHIDDRVLSVTQTIYTYSGGAHGNTMINKVAFDVKKTARLQLDEVLLEKEMAKVLQLAKEQLIKERRLDKNKTWEEQEYGFSPKKIPNNIKWASAEDGFYLPKSFNLTDQGITFVYQQYEITNYANGSPSFTLSWQDLKPYLHPQGIGIKYIEMKG